MDHVFCVFKCPSNDSVTMTDMNKIKFFTLKQVNVRYRTSHSTKDEEGTLGWVQLKAECRCSGEEAVFHLSVCALQTVSWVSGVLFSVVSEHKGCPGLDASTSIWAR